jgi:heme/copper-type cytochrome/quinol oxidase subunit 1
MMNFLRRISRIDLRKLTPTQIALGILGIIVILAVLNFVLSLAQTLLPIAALALVAYLGYQWLTSRDNNKTMVDTIAEEKTAGADSQVQTVVESKTQTATQNSTEDMQAASQRLGVEQVTNPETGFKEADLARLEAEEKQRLVDKKAEEDAIQAQLEERRKRLLGGDDAD